MKPFTHSLLLVTLVGCCLLLLGQLPGVGEPGGENSLLLLVREGQRREALEYLGGLNQETWQSLRGIVHRLIDRKMTLGAALDAYAEAYHQLYFVRSRRAQGSEGRLSRQRTFEKILRDVQVELSKTPSMACEVTDRLQQEWLSLGEDGADVGARFQAPPPAPAHLFSPLSG